MKKILVTFVATALVLMTLEACSDQRSVTLSFTPPPPAHITYDAVMKELFDASCIGCHAGGGAPNGYHLDSYAGVLGNGGDATANAIAGDTTCLLVTKVKSRTHFAWNTAEDQYKINYLIRWVREDSLRQN